MNVYMHVDSMSAYYLAIGEAWITIYKIVSHEME